MEKDGQPITTVVVQLTSGIGGSACSRRRPCGCGARLIGHVRPTKGLQILQKPVAVSVASTPERRNLVVLKKSDGAVTEGDANGIDRISIMNPLELKAAVLGSS